MKPNVIVALLLGLIVGFMVGKVVGGPAAPAQQQQAQAARPGQPQQQQQQQQQRPPPQIAQTVFKVPVGDSPVKGKPDALVTIIEFSDYQCPFCTRADATVKQVQQTYGDKVRVVMKQLPLDSLHPQARGAAQAALAAGRQGKYWEMHDRLFANQRALDDAGLTESAKAIGLDVAKWERDRKDPAIAKQVQDEAQLANSLGITGTPGFFINGRKIPGALPFEVFKTVIDEELPKAQALVSGGTPANQVYDKIMEKGVTAPPPPPTVYQKVDVPADSPSFGPKTAKVTIVEWSDFQCPFCSRAAPLLKQIKEAYPNDVRVVFRHQPLHRLHPQAQLAAEASMAAHEQGKFWEMHDKLYENQRTLDRASIEGMAQGLGLDMNKFKSALDSGKFRAKVEQDAQAGQAIGAGATPTFFINGRQHVGGGSFPQFRQMIEEEKARADKLLASGVKPDQLYQKLMENPQARAQ